MARVVVVGAGLAGLCSALALADFGHDVTVVESGPAPGGQLRYGPQPFTLPAVLRDLFRKTGRPLERELDLVPADPAARWVFADGAEVAVPNASPSGTRRALDDAFGAGAGAQWDAVVAHGDRAWRELRPLVLGHTGAKAPRHPQTLRDVAASLREPHLRAALESYATRYGADPATAPAALTVLPYLEQTFGVWTADVARLVEVLAGRGAERGATFRYDAAAGAPVHDGKRVTGVTLAGGATVDADAVVWTAPPGDLADDRRRPFRRRRDDAAPATAVRADPTQAPELRFPAGGGPAISWYDAAGGHVHGTAAGRVTAIFRRPGNVTRIRGLYLAGAGAHPGPGIALVAQSAAIVADDIGRS
ncbi:phytoene desaturase family protein [Jiangella alba]|uniref:Phytoene dehydrogenase-related protein n=1 Tax=Jiangella alba TaxID=561176 RepID=A0A1H5LIV0_9ACTN|nr:FAD-dependent oxidoreductase [Jiangella alba]SEE76940.1 Phytoene dehydrogenase-related protein [Jiangella alba]